MRRTCLWALVSLLGAGAWTPAFAQAANDKWDVVVAPYLMGASMGGSTTVRGFDVDVDVPASEIFSNLQFGAMGIIAARKGNWGFGSDLIWMALGTTVKETNVDFNQGAFAFYGMRRLSPAAELTFGLRVNTLQGTLTFKGPDISRDQDKTWVDPIVGLVLRSPDAKRMTFRLYTEIGGFGAGSDFTWQLFPTVGFSLTKQASLDFGYRWLDIDYSTGSGNDTFAYNMLTQGPVAGFAFRF
ncbi:MAG: hypothetical protein ACXWX1_12955 [Aeromicrobium sp.]